MFLLAHFIFFWGVGRWWKHAYISCQPFLACQKAFSICHDSRSLNQSLNIHKNLLVAELLGPAAGSQLILQNPQKNGTWDKVRTWGSKSAPFAPAPIPCNPELTFQPPGPWDREEQGDGPVLHGSLGKGWGWKYIFILFYFIFRQPLGGATSELLLAQTLAQPGLTSRWNSSWIQGCAVLVIHSATGRASQSQQIFVPPPV